jgi:hypothetical protein
MTTCESKWSPAKRQARGEIMSADRSSRYVSKARGRKGAHLADLDAEVRGVDRKGPTLGAVVRLARLDSQTLKSAK